MNEFKTYHPIVNFIYFVFVIGLSCFILHPLCLLVSFFCAFFYSAMLKGKKAVKANLLYVLPLMIIAALINPAFNHEGVTILLYLPSGNPLTLESLVYGLFAALMLGSVICWFSCFNEIMTSDKIICLFGKIIPSLSLIFSMTLRFVPKFSSQLRVVINAQKCMGRDVSSGSFIKRIKNGLSILSIMTTWSLENAIETADSMKSRGYGLSKRSSFSIFSFDKRDVSALFYIIILGAYVLAGFFMGKIDFTYFPSIKADDFSFYSISIFVAYTVLCMCPIIIEVKEALRWRALKSKI